MQILSSVGNAAASRVPLLSCILIFFLAIFFGVRTASAQLFVDSSFTGQLGDGLAEVLTVEPLSSGKLLVGGYLRGAAGNARSNILRLNADGSFDSTFVVGSGANDVIKDIAVTSDGKFIIAGLFTSYNGVAVGRIARLNADGTLDTTFNVGGAGATGLGLQRAIVLSTGKILIAGNIPSYNGAAGRAVMRLNADGTNDTTFATTFSSSDSADDLSLTDDGGVIVASSSSVGRLVKLNTSGAIVTTFSIGSANAYSVLALTGGKVIAAGAFFGTSGTGTVRRFNADGTLDSTFAGDAGCSNCASYRVALQSDGKIVYGGYESTNGYEMTMARRLTSAGAPDGTFTLSTSNGSTLALAVLGDNRIIVGGDFRRIGVAVRVGLTRMVANGGQDFTFAPELNGRPSADQIARMADGRYVVAGNFFDIAGSVRPYVARFFADGTLDLSFNPATIFPDPNFQRVVIDDVEVQSDGKVLVAGILGGIGTAPRQGVVSLNSDGTPDTVFNTNLNLSGTFGLRVRDVAIRPDGKIAIAAEALELTGPTPILRLIAVDGTTSGTYPVSGTDRVEKIGVQTDNGLVAGGRFTSGSIKSPFGGTGLRRFRADRTYDTTFDRGIGFDPSVTEVFVQTDGKVLVAGSFTQFNGTARSRIARVNSDGSLDTSFAPPATTFDGPVGAIAQMSDGRVAVGGAFANFNGVSRNKFALLTSAGGLDTATVSGFDADDYNSVRCFWPQSDGKLLVGGRFTNYSGVPRSSLVRLSSAVKTPFDYDGDGKTDISIFRPSNGQWWIQRSSNQSINAFTFGVSTDIMVPGDFAGDSKADATFFRPSTGEWFVQPSGTLGYFSFPFGSQGDIPVPADFDGDGKTDPAVFRPSTATWFVSKSTGGTIIVTFGTGNDRPVPADYDGDGSADIAIYRPANGQWWIQRSTAGLVVVTFGNSQDKVLAADFNGDGKSDPTLFRPSTGEWYVLSLTNGSYFSFPFGTPADIPVPGDYDGDGRADAAVFRPSTSTWYVNRTTAGLLIQGFGLSTDRPTPSAYVR